MWVVPLVVLLLFVFLVSYLWRHRRYYYLGSKLPPVLGEWPIFGSLVHFTGSLRRGTKSIIRIYNENRDHPLYRVWMGPVLWVILRDPDIMHDILLNHLNKASVYSVVGGRGLFEQQSLSTWAKHRKIMGTSFHHAALKSYVQIFHQEANLMADKMEQLAQSRRAFDPNEMVILTALGSLVKNVFRVDLEVQQKYHAKHPYLEAVASSFQIFQIRMLKPWLLLDIFYYLSGYKAQVQKNKIIQKQFIENILASIKQKISKEGDAVEDITFDTEFRRTLPFAERVLKQQANPDKFHLDTMADKDLYIEMIGLVNAGIDTVKTATSIILNLLAIHPDIQQQVYNEIQDVCSDNIDAAPTYEQLLELHTLTRVIKEALRMYPSAPFLGRSCPHDLEYKGYVIPTGATLIIFTYGVHRDPKYWANPDQFDPDRFLPSESAKRNPNVYFPFSMGPRNCIGYKYAMLFMTTTLSTILRRYRILPGDRCRSLEDIKIEFGMTLRSLPENDVRLESRRSSFSS